MSKMRAADRSSLRFAEEVKAQFSFLRQLGFSLVDSEPTFVRFELKPIYINIYHGRHSFEIGMEIGFDSSPDVYSMSEILQLSSPSEGQNYRNYATHTVKGVASGVSQLAGVAERCLSAGILEDKHLLSRLRTQRQASAKDYALQIRLEQARKAAAIAWRERDYRGVVKFLRPLRDSLSPSEIGKLKYAERHIENRLDTPKKTR